MLVYAYLNLNGRTTIPIHSYVCWKEVYSLALDRPRYYNITDLLGNTHNKLGDDRDVHNNMKYTLINARQTGGKTPPGGASYPTLLGGVLPPTRSMRTRDDIANAFYYHPFFALIIETTWLNDAYYNLYLLSHAITLA